MLRLKCSCGKPVAEGQNKCSLCAMGFAPSRQVDMAVSFQTGLNVSTRDDSGLSCTRCHARLSVADVTRQSCAYCHAAVAQNIIPVRRSRDEYRQARREQTAAVKLWPDKAPIR
jgi:protein-arginine kinase activator protein McsA